MQPASTSPTGPCFNENAAQPDQHVEMTGCLWFGVEVFFFTVLFTAAIKTLPLPVRPCQCLSPKTQLLSELKKKVACTL